ncbi:hypothetical protein CHUAL_012335 [Chamberlinius hualienensis]
MNLVLFFHGKTFFFRSRLVYKCQLSLRNVILTKMKFNTIVSVFSAVMVAINGCYVDYDDGQESNVTSEEQTDFDTLRLELIKMKLLNGLGLSEPPKIDRRHALMMKNSIARLPIINSPVTDFRENALVRRKSLRNEKKVRKYVFGVIGVSDSCASPNSTSNETVISFKLPDNLSAIESIMLSLRVSDEDVNNPHVTLKICNCAGVRFKSIYGGFTATPLPKCKQIVDDPNWNISKSGWSHILLSNMWKSVIGYKDQKILLIINKQIKSSDGKLPFLSINMSYEYRPLELKRYKREIVREIDCPEETNLTESNNTLPCCRTKFWVDIRELGWSDWIISPSGFYFYHCAGRCLNGFDKIGSNGDEIDYSIVLNAYIKKLNLKLKPCCIPKKLASLSVTMITNRNTTTRTIIPNFIVKECACIGFTGFKT